MLTSHSLPSGNEAVIQNPSGPSNGNTALHLYFACRLQLWRKHLKQAESCSPRIKCLHTWSLSLFRCVDTACLCRSPLSQTFWPAFSPHQAHHHPKLPPPHQQRSACLAQAVCVVHLTQPWLPNALLCLSLARSVLSCMASWQSSDFCLLGAQCILHSVSQQQEILLPSK